MKVNGKFIYIRNPYICACVFLYVYVKAAKVGINLIVLDDGWFGKRENDTCSLGDWVADLVKFPHGIKGLAEEVNAAGCKFGIWFEPEMVSFESVRAI